MSSSRMLCGVGEAVAVNVGVPANGVFVVTESPLRLNCWLVADEFWFMTTIANFPVFGSVYAEQLRPVVGASVAPMRTKPGFTNLE